MRINQRSKLILSCVTHFLILGILCVVPFRDFRQFNTGLENMELYSRLNVLVELLRQTEENYLLYHSEHALKKNRELIRQLGLKMEKLPLTRDLELSRKTQLEELARYGQLMDELAATTEVQAWPEPLTRDIGRIGDQLQTFGRQLLLQCQARQRAMVERFKQRLLIIVALSAMISILISLSIWRGVFQPLKKLEQAALDIARGTFRPIVTDQRGDDETQTVFKAFNHMVRELEEDQKRLIESHKLSSLGTLAAGAAHQLNNPLNNIATSSQIGLAELESGDPEITSQMLETIHNEAMRAGRIVSSLLDFSRDHEFFPRLVALADVVEQAVKLAANEIPETVQVEIAIPEDITLRLDRHKMTEVILNLLLNGVQAIGEGPGTISFSAASQPERHRVVLRVRDTGCGIDPADLGRIFDPFFTTKNEGEGSGLGLAVVYGIINKHGGSISVESEMGLGTLFLITLPLPEQEVSS
ncbi:two-component sensor histidine kinase [Desulfolithobacter dissulfuricans]|uniref:histidine kinase n=1 Tax=Desulfolithobacter dissulfuricans TaxID=2795293 RepID=A0A915XKT4_9BACT|nr:HAMP domain-containing sensor histidine kinase [Desulfolithobacter dissulfuricans]BCO08696.1 two-component sensor histidine kinase [Desulfolithobacter dissulfuricans]